MKLRWTALIVSCIFAVVSAFYFEFSSIESLIVGVSYGIVSQL